MGTKQQRATTSPQAKIPRSIVYELACHMTTPTVNATKSVRNIPVIKQAIKTQNFPNYGDFWQNTKFFAILAK